MKVFLILALGASFFIAQPAWAATPPFIPTNGKLLIIGEQEDSMDYYLATVGPVPGGFMFYTSIQLMDGLTSPSDHGGGINNAKYFIDTNPNTVVQLGLYMVGALQDIVKGGYDHNIIKLADWLKKINRPVYLRIGYEFDLPDNNYDPDAYKAAYRYIVDHLRAQGVNNVAYVWHSACLADSPDTFLTWYPGDNYVDWFGVSIFNPLQIAKAKTFLKVARLYHKPFMIAESTPAGCVSTQAKREWFKHFFDFINEEGIKVVCYINCNWDTYPIFTSMNWGDSQVQDDQEILLRWRKQIKNGFLQSSPDLFNKLSGKYSA